MFDIGSIYGVHCDDVGIHLLQKIEVRTTLFMKISKFDPSNNCKNQKRFNFDPSKNYMINFLKFYFIFKERLSD